MSGPPLREVAAAVVVHDGRVLVQTRPEGRSWSGYWEFPGGKREAGEPVERCAERECREELGLAVSARRLLHVVEWSYPHVAVQVSFVLCEVPGEAPAPPEVTALEGQRVTWADATDLRRLRFLPANEEVLTLLERLLPPTPSSGGSASRR
jgi:mutator protein MutT